LFSSSGSALASRCEQVEEERGRARFLEATEKAAEETKAAEEEGAPLQDRYFHFCCYSTGIHDGDVFCEQDVQP